MVENESGEPEWDQVTASFKEEATQHYTYVWERMDENSRGNLLRIASGKKIDRKFKHVNEDLQRRGYLVDVEGNCELFSTPFRDFVLERAAAGGRKTSFFSSLLGKKRGK